MVCPPVSWSSDNPEPKERTSLYGGYLSSPVGDLYLQRYSLLSSRDYEH